MKKQYSLLLIIVCLSILGYSQRSLPLKSEVQFRTNNKPVEIYKDLRTNTDTLFHFEGYYFWENTGNDDFEIIFEEYDGFSTHPDNYYTETTWMFGYDVISPGDTSNFTVATSWFQPAGIADDWIIMGPINVADEGGIIRWKRKFNEVYRNGYEVLIATEGNLPEDFTDTVYFVEDEMIENSVGMPIDLYFGDPAVEVNIPNEYNGNDIYVAFHHSSADMDALYFGDILLANNNTTAITELYNPKIDFNVFPNPAVTKSNIEFIVSKDTEVTLVLQNMFGEIIQTKTVKANRGINNQIIHFEDIPNGIYLITIINNGNKSTKKLIINK